MTIWNRLDHKNDIWVIRTCQIFRVVIVLPNLGREAFDQGYETGKASPNLAKYWFFKRPWTSRKCKSRSCCLVQNKDCGNRSYNLVDAPATVGHDDGLVGKRSCLKDQIYDLSRSVGNIAMCHTWLWGYSFSGGSCVLLNWWLSIIYVCNYFVFRTSLRSWQCDAITYVVIMNTCGWCPQTRRRNALRCRHVTSIALYGLQKIRSPKFQVVLLRSIDQRFLSKF